MNNLRAFAFALALLLVTAPLVAAEDSDGDGYDNPSETFTIWDGADAYPNNPDIHDRLEVLDEQSGDRRHTAWVRRTLDLAEQLERRLMRDAQETLVREDQAVTYLLAAAYPDRVGRRRHRGAQGGA